MMAIQHDCTEAHQLDEACEPCEVCQLEVENDRLQAENERLREALAKVSGIVDFAIAGGE